MIVLLCGLSGAGKTTIGIQTKKIIQRAGNSVELIDGDEYRNTLCRDLNFTKPDRIENLKRLGFVASRLSGHGVITIISAIAPYKESRDELKRKYNNVKIVFVDCNLHTLIKRDTKGLYHKALLPDLHPDKINNLTGVNDPFEIPEHPDLYINTAMETIEECSTRLVSFISQSVRLSQKQFNLKWSFRYL
jgi:adenylylsulfate kinase